MRSTAAARPCAAGWRPASCPMCWRSRPPSRCHRHRRVGRRRWGRWLVRRSLRTGELAYYLCAGPAGLPLIDLVRVAGSRWRVEEAFQAGKGLCGLDQHQVRRWGSWYRWVTLAMLASAFLVVAAVTEHTRHPPPLGLIPLTCNEIQHLFAALVAVPVADPGHRLRWSWWRRRRQARARACHYRRQAAQQP